MLYTERIFSVGKGTYIDETLTNYLTNENQIERSKCKKTKQIRIDVVCKALTKKMCTAKPHGRKGSAFASSRSRKQWKHQM
jgi:hypothetical protein